MVPAPVFIVQSVVSLVLVDYMLSGVEGYVKGLNPHASLALAFIVYPILTIPWASFHEEFKFRGYMQGVLEDGVGAMKALIAVALFFSYSHFWNYLSFSLSYLEVLTALTYLLLSSLALRLEYVAV